MGRGTGDGESLLCSRSSCQQFVQLRPSLLAGPPGQSERRVGGGRPPEVPQHVCAASAWAIPLESPAFSPPSPMPAFTPWLWRDRLGQDSAEIQELEVRAAASKLTSVTQLSGPRQRCVSG